MSSQPAAFHRLSSLFIAIALLPLLAQLACAQSNTQSSPQSAGNNNNQPFEEQVAAKKSSTPQEPLATAEPIPLTNTDAESICMDTLKGLPGPINLQELQQACKKTQTISGCTSVQGTPIFHYDRQGSDPRGKRVLTISLIHGDEVPAGSVARAWMARLEKIDPRNSWRVIPVANPDGLKMRTRFNSNNVDLNRNFPSKDWDEKALAYWENRTKKDRRRYPGDSPASEAETKCLVQHINDYKPDFVISVHTPLGVLDFDGPPVGNPGFRPLPWVGLGNFPGSLGRYMWVDNNVPVLTIELRGNTGIRRLEEFDHLQDITGTVAIQAGKLMHKKEESSKAKNEQN